MQNENWDGAQEVQSNWFKFNEVGDKIKGTLLKKEIKKGDEVFGDQLVIELRKSDGSVWNVGISVRKEGTVARLNNCKIGEIIGIVFESQGEPTKKGFHPAKNLKIVTFGMDPEYKEFEDGGSSAELPDM